MSKKQLRKRKTQARYDCLSVKGNRYIDNNDIYGLQLPLSI